MFSRLPPVIGRTRLTVLIATRDRPPHELDRCIRAIMRGTVRPDEIVVVDQGRDDRAARVVERAVTEDPGMPVRRLPQPPRGLGAAQNAGLSASSGDVVAVTDDDCVPDRRWLEEVRGTLAASDLAAVTGRVLPLPASGTRVAPVATRTDATPQVFEGKSVPWPVGSGNNFAVLRDWLVRIGGVDERLGLVLPVEEHSTWICSTGCSEREPHPLRAGMCRSPRAPDAPRTTRAAIPLRLRDGRLDRSAVTRRRSVRLRLLAGWFLSRILRLARAARAGDAISVFEEVLVVAGTVSGVFQPLRRARPDAPRDAVSGRSLPSD